MIKKAARNLLKPTGVRGQNLHDAVAAADDRPSWKAAATTSVGTLIEVFNEVFGDCPGVLDGVDGPPEAGKIRAVGLAEAHLTFG